MSPRLLLAIALAATSSVAPPEAGLVARAILPADTFASGPAAGHHLGAGPFNGVKVPLPSQPVQGFSGLVALANGDFLANIDNGFGTLENSADHWLRLYRLQPQWHTGRGGTGALRATVAATLSDPDHHVAFTITHEGTRERILTGADFDPESLVRAPDGTLRLGEEFGPSLLHVDARGRLLEPPIELPDPAHPGKMLASPQSPRYEESTPQRLMNALADAVARGGGTRPPICSPDDHLIADRRPAGGLATRSTPPAGSGLARASSKVFDAHALAIAGFPVVPWTVNDPARMRQLIQAGCQGLITDQPDRLRTLLHELDAVRYFLPDGRVNGDLFDLQGHRGARGLRPENTLPAFEAGLDEGVTTLETDCRFTRDGVLVLSHDPNLEAPRVRLAGGGALPRRVPIRAVTFKELQHHYVADGLLGDRPDQRNDRALSPVAVAFARENRLSDPYVMPSLAQLLKFTAYYQAYYAQHPAGVAAGVAERRARTAASVRFDLETKVRPYAFDGEPAGDAAAWARAIAHEVTRQGLAARTTVESFDFRSLYTIAREYPAIGIVALFADGPWMPDPRMPGAEDGTNLQAGADGRSPWLAGLRWPYRHTFVDGPPRVRQSAGVEGLGRSPDGKRLYAVLEKPLVGDPGRALWIQEFDVPGHRWTGRRWTYPLEPRAISVGDVAFFNDHEGVALERDGSQGDLTGFKRVYAFTLGQQGQPVHKRLVADLLALTDKDGLSRQGASAGDVGLGPHFAFPYECPEGVAVLDATHLAVIDDNNYPFGHARHHGTGRPDDSELVVLGLPRKLGRVTVPVPPHGAW